MSRGPALTRIGTVGSPFEPVVDHQGVVTPGGVDGAWSLDWWIGADDRWHLPAEEPAVRQGLVGHAPVLETRVKVPGGDAVHRAYGVRTAGNGTGSGQEHVVVEIENDSPAPFAVALVVRPSVTGAGAEAPTVRSITVAPVAGGRGRDQAQLICVNANPALVLPRPAARATIHSGSVEELAESVTSGGAGRWPPAPASDHQGRTGLAMVLPVTHRTTLRVLMPLGGATTNGWPVALPSVKQVVSGWTAQAERGAHFVLPDPSLMTALAVDRRQLRLAGPQLRLVRSFDHLGWHRDATEALLAHCSASAARGAAEDELADPQLLLALHEHWRLTRDRSLVTAGAPATALAAGRIARRFSGAGVERLALSAAHELFLRCGERRAAADVSALLRRSPAPDPARLQLDPNPAAGPSAPAEGRPRPGASTGSAAGRVVDHVRSLLLDDSQGETLQLLPGWLSGYGQSLDVRDLPTASGRLSFSVRWHGDRPAILWELEPHAGLGPATISAPELDRAWLSTEPKGEALLAPVPTPPSNDPGSADPERQPITSAQPPRSVSPLLSDKAKASVTSPSTVRSDPGQESGAPPEPGASFS